MCLSTLISLSSSVVIRYLLTLHDYVLNPGCQCTSAIAQLTKGRNKEDKEGPELHSLAAAALEKDYKQRAPAKLPLLASALRSLKIS